MNWILLFSFPASIMYECVDWKCNTMMLSLWLPPSFPLENELSESRKSMTFCFRQSLIFMLLSLMKYNTEGHHALRAHHRNHIPNMCDTVFVFVFLRLACIWTLQNLFTKTVLKIDPMRLLVPLPLLCCGFWWHSGAMWTRQLDHCVIDK